MYISSVLYRLSMQNCPCDCCLDRSEFRIAGSLQVQQNKLLLDQCLEVEFKKEKKKELIQIFGNKVKSGSFHTQFSW